MKTLCFFWCLIGLCLSPFATSAAFDPVSLQLKWKHAFQFAGFYMALEKGYYAEAGLDVTLIEGGLGKDSVEHVLHHQHAYGVAGSGALLAFAQGRPIQTFGTIFQHSALVLLVKKDSGIKSFADLRGKRIMMQSNVQDVDTWAALNAAGLSEYNYTLQPQSFDLTDLLANKTDAFSAYTTEQPHQLKLQGIPYRILYPKDEGIDFYGDILITSNHETSENPERVHHMLQASMRGWVYALEHMDETVDFILKTYNTQHFSREHLMFEAQASAKLIMHNLMQVGYMNHHRWQHIAKVYESQGLVAVGLDVEPFIYQPQFGLFAMMKQHLWILFLSVLMLVLLVAGSTIMMLKKTVRLKSRKLIKSEAIYRQMVECSPEPIAIHSKGIWVYANPASMRLFGAKQDSDVVGHSVFSFVHPDCHELVKSRIGPFVDGESQAMIEEQLLRCDGSPIWAEVTALSLMYEGQPSTMVLSRDITARKQKDAQTKQQIYKMAALRDVLEHLNMAKAVDDAYNTAIQGAMRVLGCDRSALLVFDDEDKLHFAAWHGLSEAYRQAFDDCKPWLHSDKNDVPVCIEDVRSKPNMPAWMVETNVQEGVAALMMFPSVEGSYFVGNFIMYFDQPKQFSEQEISFGKILLNDLVATLSRIEDIKEKEAMQSQVEHTQRLESLGVLAGGIAHDFNNILTGIMANAVLAERKCDMDTQTSKKCLQRIVQASDRAALLCKQMLDYSGKGHFVIKPLHLSALVTDIMSLVESSVHKGVSISCALDEHVPWIEADESQLQQVVMNLIINASEAMEGNNGLIALRTGVVDAEHVSGIVEGGLFGSQYVYLEVKDTGCGMDDEAKGKLFEPFFTTKFTGRGLGMSAVLGIVRGHGGAIAVESEVGKGTTFTLLFPASDKVVEKVDEIDLSASEPLKTFGTVLIVDDEEMIRESASMMLEDMGFSTLYAVDGEDGIAMYSLRQDDIVLVLLDMTMPKLDGKGCFKALKEIDPDVQVVLSSGYSEQEAMKNFDGLGVAAFMQKPYLPEVLEQTMHGVLLKK